MGTPRLMIVVFAATGVVVAAVAALAFQSWWLLAVVLVVHALATAVVVGYTYRRAGESYAKPDPVTEARVEEEHAEAESGGARHDRPAVG